MNTDKFDEYLNDRYNDQVNWYSRKASNCKIIYQIFQWIVIVLSASLPVLISTLPEKTKWITIVISILLAISTAALKVFKWQETWINYRTISETLKKERHFYDADLDEYANTDNKEKLFVERVENLISRENSLWVMIHFEKKGKKEK